MVGMTMIAALELDDRIAAGEAAGQPHRAGALVAHHLVEGPHDEVGSGVES